jgi:hypothetical protein
MVALFGRDEQAVDVSWRQRARARDGQARDFCFWRRAAIRRNNDIS